ncbi:MAG: type IV pilin accessory protein [Proteobacteria bacterium]|nr:type IV pilin accessory protein [Pseudomonadota bacterium]
MGTRIFNRWQASGIHLLISLTIATIVFSIMLAVWFPGPLFWADGGNRLLLILVGVDVTLGPLITLVVYRHGKRGMKFDLAVIALLQVSALAYGLHVVYYARPAFIVFAKDQFQVAAVGEIAPAEYRKAKLPQFSHPPLGGPLLAYAVMPTDPKELAEVVDAAMSGRDVETMPKLFAPYAEHAHDVLQHAKTLAQLRKSDPTAAKVVDAYMAHSGWKEADVRYVRLMAANAWCAVLIDARTAMPKKIL